VQSLSLSAVSKHDRTAGVYYCMTLHGKGLVMLQVVQKCHMLQNKRSQCGSPWH